MLPDSGKHHAVRTNTPGDAGTCCIVLGVTASSRVDTVVLAGTNTRKACELGAELAKRVEPKPP
jgi:hypothetical protein